MARRKRLWQFKWHSIVLYLVIAGISLVLLGRIIPMITGDMPDYEGANQQMVQAFRTVGLVGYLFMWIALFTTIFAILLFTAEFVSTAKETAERLETINSDIRESQSVLVQINKGLKLSETTKSLIFRDEDALSLREAVFEKLQRQQFDTAYDLIDDISQYPGYKKLATQLRSDANRYQTATDTERINQVIANIHIGFEKYQWPKASAQIEKLIAAYPNSQKALDMRLELVEKKEQRKKELLKKWDETVQRQETDRGLDILKELDMYLTPNEAIALQESARDIFRTKLHNLGVQFSLAVSEKQWQKAMEAGEEITREFPNSKMADEIRSKIEVLRQRAAES